MSDLKSFGEVNKEINIGINELYNDAKCLLKCLILLLMKWVGV